MSGGGVEPLREALRCSPKMLMPSSGPGCWRCWLAAPCFRAIRSRASKSRDRPSMPQHSADSDSVTANAWITLGTSLAAAGQEEEGLAAFERVSHLARSNTRTLLRFYINYSDALNHVGRYEDAASQALSGVEMASELGLQRSFGAMLAGNAAEPLLALGQWARASAMIERALELDPPAHHHAHLRLLQAWLHVWRGQLDEADAVLAEFRPSIS